MPRGIQGAPRGCPQGIQGDSGGPKEVQGEGQRSPKGARGGSRGRPGEVQRGPEAAVCYALLHALATHAIYCSGST